MYQMDQSISVLRVTGGIFPFYSNFNRNPGQTPHLSHKRDARLIWESFWFSHLTGYQDASLTLVPIVLVFKHFHGFRIMLMHGKNKQNSIADSPLS